jgi:hypothetical protein
VSRFPVDAGLSVPMLNVPSALPVPALLFLAAVLLAALDMAGAIAAKRWATGGSTAWFVGGVLMFVVLFWVYGSALQYAELSIVTMGWIVMLQVGLLVVDRVQNGVVLSSGQWVAVAGILALQGYLVLVPPGSAP